MSKLRLMSQNQWNCTPNQPAWEEKGLDCSAKFRMQGHVRVFRELMPDVVGGQEVNKDMQQYFLHYALREGLPYAQVYGNYTPLFYRPDRLELLDTGYLLYPETVEGYEGRFNDALSKSCNLGVVRVKEDGKVFIFAGTHLWWMNGSNPQSPSYRAGSDEVRAMQMREAIAFIESFRARYGNCPVIFGGDMNTGYDSKAIRYALTEGGYDHAHDVAVDFRNEEQGYHSCGPKGYTNAWQDRPFKTAIDHILVKGMPENAVRRFDRYTPEYYLPLSDHAPVFVDIVL